MRYLLSIFLVLATCGVACAQHEMPMPAKATSITIMAGVGQQHHPVSTPSTEAQQFFDQGLRLIYAFNHDEAARSFQHAAELDRKSVV